jgi:2-polyprenyl-6-methoxyphenol hydroxylase-like FAD-dependent oxidoreductase
MEVTCCIVGGGPAGMMLGLLLARAGIEVAVLEKHADFFRDFRGDTIHPSTLELMHELGLLEDFLAQPHDEVTALGGVIGGTAIGIADFTHLPTHCQFLALMPQWDFLNFLKTQAEQYPTFHLLMQTEATDLLMNGDKVSGVRATTPAGERDITAQLTVGCDGRHSRVREKAGLAVEDLGAPMDVLWFRLSRRASDPGQALGYVDAGRILILIGRADYWQCALVIAKGGFPALQAKGIIALQDRVAASAPFLRERVSEIDDWKKVSLLTVTVDRLREWSRDGLLCIGDAAHAMSPIGGVGINLAIQDAVATANLLRAPLAAGDVTPADLRAVQARRTFPTKMTQGLQLLIQNRIISGVLESRGGMKIPRLLALYGKLKFLHRLPAQLVGIGFRPEHIA